MVGWHQYLGKGRRTDGKTDSMNGAYLGPRYSNYKIKAYFNKNGVTYLK